MTASKLTAPRALTATVARRLIRTLTVIASVITVVSFIISGLLAYFFTGWWWILAGITFIIFGFFLLIRFIFSAAVRIIYPNKLTREQSTTMNSFIDTIQEILEAKSTPPIIMMLICIKDLILHRDIVTIKTLIRDTSRLRSEYKKLEQLFQA